MSIYVIIPVASALIGYLTNVLAIKMLFRPIKPYNILGYKLQGVFPKRQAEIADSIGKLVEDYLLSADDLYQAVNTPRVKEQIISGLVVLLQERLQNAWPKMLSGIINFMKENIEKVIRQEVEAMLNRAVSQGKEHLEKQKPISKMVEKKILAFQLDELEAFVKTASSRELRFIEIIGGILGFIIGLVQVGFLLFWSI